MCRFPLVRASAVRPLEEVVVSVNMLRFVCLTAALAALAGTGACGPDASDSAGRPGADGEGRSPAGEAGPRATGAVRGVVRDARTDAPVSGVHVSAGAFATATDEMGRYVLPFVPRGKATVHAYLRGYRPDSATAAVRTGETAETDLSLVPADPPCCDLEGDWSAEFVLDSAGLNPAPGVRVLTGRLTFAHAPTGGASARTAEAVGRSGLDFSALLDGSLPGDVGAVAGEVFHGDSVAITLQPRFGDWAVELRGRVAGDTVRGSWFQRASCCGAYGHFSLVRD